MPTQKVKAKDLTITLLTDQPPGVVFNAINNVRGWWSSRLEGNSEKLHDEFIYRHGKIHYSKQKLVEVIPDKKVVWLVLDSRLTFVKTQDEWTGTKVSFEVSKKKNKTVIVFTHHGLVPAFECYDACNDGWSYYVKESLLKLINTGKGQPD